MNSLSGLPPIYVDGFRCQTLDRENSTSASIFIPSMELIISDDGSACRSEKNVISARAEQVLKNYIDECNQKQCLIDQTKLNELIVEAQEAANEKILVPFKIAEQLNTHISERCQENSRTKNSIIAGLAKQIFANYIKYTLLPEEYWPFLC